MLRHISEMPDVDDYRWNHPEYDESALERSERAPQVHVCISWFLRDLRGTKAVFHSGGDDGFITRLILFPEKKAAVVWMVNCDDNSAGLSGIDDAAVAAALN
jgi:hypothetical protein